MSRSRINIMVLSLVFVLFMTFPSIVRAGSAGNQGEVEFYYDDSSLEPSEPEKPTPTTPSQPPSKVLSLPQTGEKLTPYYLIGLGMISLAGVGFWKRQRDKEGSSDH